MKQGTLVWSVEDDYDRKQFAIGVAINNTPDVLFSYIEHNLWDDEIAVLNKKTNLKKEVKEIRKRMFEEEELFEEDNETW